MSDSTLTKKQRQRIEALAVAKATLETTVRSAALFGSATKEYRSDLTELLTLTEYVLGGLEQAYPLKVIAGFDGTPDGPLNFSAVHPVSVSCPHPTDAPQRDVVGRVIRQTDVGSGG